MAAPTSVGLVRHWRRTMPKQVSFFLGGRPHRDMSVSAPPHPLGSRSRKANHPPHELAPAFVRKGLVHRLQLIGRENDDAVVGLDPLQETVDFDARVAVMGVVDL